MDERYRHVNEPISEELRNDYEKLHEEGLIEITDTGEVLLHGRLTSGAHQDVIVNLDRGYALENGLSLLPDPLLVYLREITNWKPVDEID